MEPADGQRGRDGAGSQRRSPLDIIMSQIRRKRSASDRKPLGRFSSRTSDRTGISEEAESEKKGPSPGAAVSVENERDAGWGRVCVFSHKLGKRADSRSSSVAHCDSTATDSSESASLLQFFPRLEDVDVSWNESIGGSLTTSTSHLRHVGAIRTSKLCSCRSDADDVAASGEALPSTPLSEISDSSWNSSISGGALRDSSGKLPPSLKELHSVACQLSAADAAASGGSVPSSPKLCVLDASCNPQSAQEAEAGGFGESAASLSHAVSSSTSRSQACGLTPHSLHALGSSLCRLPSVKDSDSSCNRSSSGGSNRLTCHSPHITSLESLDLHLCSLEAADSEASVQVSPSSAASSSLDVSSNKRAGGVVHRSVSASPSTQMKRSPSNGCRSSEESYAASALAAPYSRTVDVSWCKVVGGRLPPSSEASQPSAIVELHLSSCGLTTDDLRHLADVCRRGRLSSLRVSDLSYNGSVEDSGWAASFTAGGSGSSEEADVSLRPSTSAPCSAWSPASLGASPRMPASGRSAMRRWSVGEQEARQSRFSMKTRNVRSEWDSEDGDVKTSGQEESQPEE